MFIVIIFIYVVDVYNDQYSVYENVSYANKMAIYVHVCLFSWFQFELFDCISFYW